MSKIDTLIQELQQKKKKLDYLEYIKDLLSGDQKCIDFLEVQEEILQKLLPLIDKLAADIEESIVSEAKPSTGTEQLTSQEIKILKGAAQKAIEKATQTPDAPPAAPQSGSPYDNSHPRPPAPPKKPQPKGALPPQDKMNFAMENRHLGNKTVRVMDKNSDQIITSGTVVGLDAPNVIVKTVEGHTIEVPLNKILLGE
jgi:hypothetical protein